MFLKILFAFFIQFSLFNRPIIGELFPIEMKYPLKGTPPPPGSPWPMPKLMEGTTDKLLYFKEKYFTFVLADKSFEGCSLLNNVIDRYRNILFPEWPVSPKEDELHADQLIRVLEIKIESIHLPNDCIEPPKFEDVSEEEYKLSIGEQSVLEGKTVWGVLRGLETFSQLTYLVDDETKQLCINDSTIISDVPRFSYRGIHIDTARHYQPISIIRKQIEAMSYNKFNIFHWHITDDQSFPFVSETYPELSEKGAYTQNHIYTKKDVKDIIEYARNFGVRVIPEFDTPGHVNSWSKSHPELITVCWKDGKPYQDIYSVQAKAEILNPSREELYPFLSKLFDEIHRTFPDSYIHLGMDEVYPECWNSNPDIQKWKKKMNITDVQQYYSERMLEMMKKLNYNVIVWQDVWDDGVELDKSAIIQIWKDKSDQSKFKKWEDYVSKTTGQGRKTILSAPWYLNYISYGMDWKKYYEVEPLNFEVKSEEQKKFVLGGEACFWSEYIDGTNALSRYWPRASAVAERLWSPANVKDVEVAKYRLDEHRCRLLRRGINAQPILNGFCGDYEFGMENSLIENDKVTFMRQKRNNAQQYLPQFLPFFILLSFACNFS
ncbi:hypothetical protein SNEBB_000296 [Seison nebaliae]|nr:hypothetical protein SNEBB_000296 [Seison nebaliae]